MAKIGKVALWIVTIIVGLLFIAAGLPKTFRPPEAVEMFANWGYAPWFLLLIGVLEVIGGITLMIPRLAPYAALGLGVVMLGAAYTHLSHQEGLEVVRPLIFLVGLAVIGWARRPRRKSAAV